jgi:hypothetical protein
MKYADKKRENEREKKEEEFLIEDELLTLECELII